MSHWTQTVTAKVLGIGVLALVMYLTRRIDWYAYVPMTAEPAAAAAASPEPPAAIMERS
ncbi:MAG: hypothetical protein ACYCZD_11735 [Rhodanobacter sp.]